MTRVEMQILKMEKRFILKLGLRANLSIKMEIGKLFYICIKIKIKIMSEIYCSSNIQTQSVGLPVKKKGSSRLKKV